VKNELR
jgi:tetratricopeptide (TPR) repeat protein